jgi:hypothetical protein
MMSLGAGKPKKVFCRLGLFLYPILDSDRFQADFSCTAESIGLLFDLRSVLY